MFQRRHRTSTYITSTSMAVQKALTDAADERRSALLEFGRLSLRWLAFIVPSVLIPILLSYSIKDKAGNAILGPFEQLVIGAFVFVMFTLASLLQQVVVISRATSRDSRVARIEDDLDAQLQNIRYSYARLLEREEYYENFYAQYFTQVISLVERTLHRAVSEKSLEVDEYTYKASEIFTEIIARRNRDTLRLVHYTSEVEFIIDLWGQDYYRRISNLCCNGNVQVKRLIVFNHSDELKDPTTGRLLTFHQRNRGYDYRTVQRDVWDRILDDFNIREHGDMGIWGELFAYRSSSTNATHICGTYTTDSGVVGDCIRAFERAWDFAEVPAPVEGGPMTVYELATGKIPPSPTLERELSFVGGSRGRTGIRYVQHQEGDDNNAASEPHN